MVRLIFSLKFPLQSSYWISAIALNSSLIYLLPSVINVNHTTKENHCCCFNKEYYISFIQWRHL